MQDSWLLPAAHSYTSGTPAHMRQTWIIRGLLTFTLFAQVRHAGSQADAAQSAARYRLSVSVDEVDLTFHAADATASLSTT